MPEFCVGLVCTEVSGLLVLTSFGGTGEERVGIGEEGIGGESV